MTIEENKRALELAGQLASIARSLVGGRDITSGQRVEPANLQNVSDVSNLVRAALDRYDEYILEISEIEYRRKVKELKELKESERIKEVFEEASNKINTD